LAFWHDGNQNLCTQHVSWSPDGKMFVAVGDDPQGKLVDAKSGMVGCLVYFIDVSVSSLCCVL